MVCLSARQSCSMGLRMSGGQDERKEDGLVEISREELRALAEKAGIRIQIGNTPLNSEFVLVSVASFGTELDAVVTPDGKVEQAILA